MAKKYLDDTGLTYLWGKLKAYFQPKLVSGTNIKTINNESLLGSGDISISGGGAKTFYGVCSDTASTVAKTVAIDNFTSSDLVTGVTITVKFSYINSASSPTLNVSSTGAKSIKKYGTTAIGTTAKTSWSAGGVVALTYDGTNWIVNDHIDDTGSTPSTGSATALDTGTSTTGYLWTPKILHDYIASKSGTVADYIVEEGTDGIWTYRKWNNGTYDAWYVGAINLGTGTAWLNGAYYHAATSALTPPSFSKSVTSLTGANNSGTLSIYAGHIASTYQTYWVNGVQAATNGQVVRLDMHGTWE